MTDKLFLSILTAPILLYDLNFTNILKYTEAINTAHDCANNYNHVMIKGQALFHDGFVCAIQFNEAADVFAIEASVKAEMRKTVTYKVTCNITKGGEVKEGTCECPGGMPPACCKHVFGLLSALEDYSRQELYKAPTDRLQTWHHPKAKKVSPKQLSLLKHLVDGDASINVDALACLPGTAPIFGVLASPSSVMLGDYLSYKKTIPLPAFVITYVPSFAPKDQVLNLDAILFYHSEVCGDLPTFFQLEKNTIGQNSSLWHVERDKRLTASVIHQIINCRDSSKIAETILNDKKKDISQIPPVKLGRRLEPMVKNIVRAKFSNHIFRNTGLVVHPFYPFIAASPDGLLFSSDDPMIVEVKVTWNPKHLTLSELCKERRDFPLYFSFEWLFKLKQNHKYFYQIQCQLFCTNLNKCLFCLFYDFKRPIHMELIYADSNFWADNCNKLSQFYFSHYLPKYLNK